MIQAFHTSQSTILLVGAEDDEPELVEAASHIPGVSYEPPTFEEKGRLSVPRTAWMLEPVRELFLRAGAATYSESWPFTEAPAFMHPYQADALHFLLNHQGGLLAFHMGLGKTVVAAEYARVLRDAGTPGPAVILAPKYLRKTWRDELVKFHVIERPEDLCVLDGRDLDGKCWRADAPFYFVHYEIVDAWWSRLYLQRPAVLIVDEAHLIKNGRTRRAKYAKLVASSVPRRVLLTGTPVQNRPGEIWNLLDTLCGAWTWGKPTDFRIRYAGAYHDQWGLRDTEPTNTAELAQRLADCAIFKRAEDVIDQLPPLQRIAVEVPFEGSEAHDYAVLLGQMDPSAVLDALLEGRVGQDTLVMMDRLRKLTSEAKVEATVNEALSALSQGSSVVVFAWQRSTAATISKKVASALSDEVGSGAVSTFLIEGSQAQSVRDEAVGRFQRCPIPAFLAATYGSLGVGANLEKASVVLMHDLDWVPGSVLQAEARVFRPASEVTRNRITISKWILAEHSLDTFLARTLLRKSRTVDALLGGADSEKFAVLDGVAAEDDKTPDEMLRAITDYWKKYGGST